MSKLRAKKTCQNPQLTLHYMGNAHALITFRCQKKLA